MPTRPAPHPPINFPLSSIPRSSRESSPQWHNTATPCLPSAQLIRIGTNSIHNLLGSDGRLNRWLLDGAMGLSFEDFDVPPMERGRREDLFEHSCVEFFDALFRYTPLVRCLALVDWDLESRIWRDFVRWLGLRYSQTTHRRPFPNVIELRMVGMFEQFNERARALVFIRLPLVAHDQNRALSRRDMGVMLDALRHDDTLCPSLKRIRLDDGLMVYRYSPFPFASVDADAWPLK
ncbi:hypothetical protein R3P38DRAFT_3166100 [Favolaschia claudopus]|uniref:Uncharacterized protein n=1 Tax=Favolaschia claudopus TaxID=2862362 RepID=A0AAW0EM00_9AGAR